MESGNPDYPTEPRQLEYTLLGPPAAQKVGGAAGGQLDTHPLPQAKPLATSLLPDGSHLGCGMSGYYVITLRLETLISAWRGGESQVPVNQLEDSKAKKKKVTSQHSHLRQPCVPVDCRP